jgi:UDP-N-acetylglucosamine--N-acetylmuramyl-(pentapeptide) pyrophosphoryl-undecaprenol N-acetylglucosamine transferase
MDARVEPFLYRMAEEMRRADVIVSRAGATTLSELAAIGRPAILVPFPGATDEHQRRNAEVLAAAGAATVIDQTALTGERLAGELLRLAEDRAARIRMSAEMGRFARRDAADRIVDMVLELAAGA